MHKVIIVTAMAALAACSKPAAAPAANDADMAAANEVVATPAAATASPISETSWEFTQDGKPMQESIDANGNYIMNSGTEHIDHGKVVMKDGKACFTSAMNKDPEECWTDPKLAVGASGETVSDKGEKLAIKRVAYVPKTM